MKKGKKKAKKGKKKTILYSQVHIAFFFYDLSQASVYALLIDLHVSCALLVTLSNILDVLRSCETADNPRCYRHGHLRA